MIYEFTNEEIIKAFDEVAKHFYDHNFGQMSKADSELLMFHLYFDKISTSSYSKSDKCKGDAVKKLDPLQQS